MLLCMCILLRFPVNCAFIGPSIGQSVRIDRASWHRCFRDSRPPSFPLFFYFSGRARATRRVVARRDRGEGKGGGERTLFHTRACNSLDSACMKRGRGSGQTLATRAGSERGSYGTRHGERGRKRAADIGRLHCRSCSRFWRPSLRQRRDKACFTGTGGPFETWDSGCQAGWAWGWEHRLSPRAIPRPCLPLPAYLSPLCGKRQAQRVQSQDACEDPIHRLP